MSFRKRVVLLISAAISLAFLVACGSSNNKSTPPPTGAFSNSNLNGTYVFSTLGTDPTSGATMTMAGAFTACGCSGGTISTGTFDYYDPSVALQAETGNTISSGSYNVTADGRGQITLANNSTLGTVTLDFVLNSTNGGQVSEYNTFGTGSGTLVLQTSVTLGSNYAYSVSGENVVGADPLAYAQAGSFTVGSGGVLSNTAYDLTQEDLVSGQVTGIANSGFTAASTLTVGTGTTPGQATFIDPSGNTYTFDVFAISASDLKLFETDNTFSAVGDAFPQATSLPSGTLAFTMNGVDTSLAPLSMGGLLTFSGTSITSGIQDYNDGAFDAASGTGLTTNTAVLGAFTDGGTLTAGRAGLQLTNFYNGADSTVITSTPYTFAAYPTTNGILLLEIDGVGITAGNALPQSNTSFASAQGYGVDISALNIGTGSIYEEDDIAEFTSTSTGFSGLVDVNDEGQTFFDKTFDGTYSSVTSGRYSFIANSSSGFNGVSGAVYTVDGSTLLFLEGDTFQVGTGMLQVQNASGSDAQAAASRVPVFRGLLAASKHAAKRKQK